MIQINLLKYFDKSFSEIYQIEHGEIEEQKPKKSRSKVLLFFYALILCLLIVALVLTVKVFTNKEEKHNLKVKSKSVNKKNKGNINNKFDNISKNKENEKYVKIGELELLPNNKSKISSKAINTGKDNKKFNNNNVAAKQSVEKKNKTASQKKSKKLSFIIKRVDYSNLKRIKSVASKHGKSLVILRKYAIKTPVWLLYKIDSSSKKYIAGKPVVFLKQFVDKESAISYAKKYHLRAVIKKEYKEKVLYDIKISGFHNRKEIESFKLKNE